MKNVELLVHDDPNEVASAVAERIRGVAHDVLTRRERFVLAVSGGSTPKPLFRRLRAIDFPWPQSVISFVDERAVPPSHESSNFRLVEEELLSGLKERPKVLRVEADDGDHHRAAAAYEQALKKLYPVDVAVIGMGGDGHTASLFPGAPDLTGEVVATSAPPTSPIEARISMSYGLLARIETVFLLVTGTSKSQMLKRVLHEPSELPIRKLLDMRKKTYIYADTDTLIGRSSDHSGEG